MLNQQINQQTNQPVNQQVNQQGNQSIKQSTSQSIEQLADRHLHVPREPVYMKSKSKPNPALLQIIDTFLDKT